MAIFPWFRKSRPQGYYSGKYLTSGEFEWVKLQPFLLQRGYQLRPRFQPNWIPSWKRWNNFGRQTWLSSEDGLQVLVHVDLLDAIRVKDGKRVVMKMVKTEKFELPLLLLLNEGVIRKHPDNKIVDVLDVLLRPDTDETALVVMPHLINFALIPFQFVSEVAEAFVQFLDGLSFLHFCNIAHRDICFFNLMMDGTDVAPAGFHFATDNRPERGNPDQPPPYKARRSVPSIRYYIVDVGISRWFLHTSKIDDRRIYGQWGQDNTVPEWQQQDEPHDPFKVDVYQLGSVFRRIITHYEGLDMFQPLVSSMTSINPNDRPTAKEATKVLKELVSSFTESELSRRTSYKRCSPEIRKRLESGLESPPELLKYREYLFPEFRKC
ncbi:hypothetical protein D9619_007421 [Psilocybe cf. subviscida]|uniref:Protein kinase domain-containing protein n=1 Tax=Psilocybe cf. subviscida TaxID=2480587 RepID=A0A8H5EWZ7_9AGAR|nr:hypothetical protein D9619_007421 [Psilocybe cf. subviscida]